MFRSECLNGKLDAFYPAFLYLFTANCGAFFPICKSGQHLEINRQTNIFYIILHRFKITFSLRTVPASTPITCTALSLEKQRDYQLKLEVWCFTLIRDLIVWLLQSEHEDSGGLGR